MKLQSRSFKNEGFIPSKYSMDGGNTSPHLEWSDFPENTKSFAIFAHDPDAPTQSGFWHWQLVNIDKNITSIEEGMSGKLSNILEKNNDADMPGWYGPQPPKGHGKHRYVFTVMALDVDKIDTTIEQSRAYTSFMIYFHIIDSAQIIGYFETK